MAQAGRQERGHGRGKRPRSRVPGGLLGGCEDQPWPHGQCPGTAGPSQRRWLVAAALVQRVTSAPPRAGAPSAPGSPPSLPPLGSGPECLPLACPPSCPGAVLGPHLPPPPWRPEGGSGQAQPLSQTSLLANCQAPRRPWLASHMSTVFISLLCFPSFLGAAIFLCYAVWQVKPSSLCGPFRGLDSMYEAGKVWVRRLERAGPRVSWLPWVHRYLVENTFPVYLLSALLLAIIYLNIQVVKGQREVISLLKEQISNEGEDKIFLINKLHSVCERKERSGAGRTQEVAVPPARPADHREA